MRPKLLEIEGLQSFRDIQKVDFDALGETGLFGIFGPTGSGKSTVLDAITFALYGKVKRADRGTQGIINTNMNTAKVAFTFELLKEGARKTYRVERSYQRKKGSENSCEPKVARLLEINAAGAIPLCDKASDVSGSIEELLGLSHDDFTRAVVLPQNSFQEFLLLDNSKKRDMLERIFYLEEYGKQLLDKLNRKISTLRSRIDVLSGELAGCAEASGEALKAAEKEMAAAIAERSRVEKEFKLLDAKHNEAREVWQLVCDLSVVGRREEQHTALKDDVNKKRTILERALKADGLAGMIKKNRELSQKLTETQAQLSYLLGDFPRADDDLREMRQKYEGLKNETASEQPGLVGLKTRLTDALGVRSEIKALQDVINELQFKAAKLQDEITGKNAGISVEKSELEALEQSVDGLAAEMRLLTADPEYRRQIQEGAGQEAELAALAANKMELEHKAAVIKQTIAGLELKLAQIREGVSASQKALEETGAKIREHEASGHGDRNSVLEYRDRISILQTVYDVLKLRKSEMDELKSKISTQRSHLEELAKKAAMLDEERARNSVLCGQRRLELDNAVREKERHTALELSKNLKEGVPCPVCGSLNHPLPAAGAGRDEIAVQEQQLERARVKLAEAEESCKAAERAVLAVNEQIKALTEQNGQTVKELETRTAGYAAEKLRLPEELRALEPDAIRLELEKMGAMSVEKLKALEVREKQQEELKKELELLSDRLAAERLAENGVDTELNLNKDILKQAEESLAAAIGVLGDKRRGYEEFVGKYGVESAAAELKRLTENDHKLNGLQKQAEQAREAAGKKRVLMEQLKTGLGKLSEESIRIRSDLDGSIRQKAEKAARLAELAGTADIEAEIRRIDGKLAEYVRLEKEYQERLQLLEKRYNDLATAKSTLENQQAIYSDDLKKDEDLLEAILKDKGFSARDEIEKAILPQQEQKAIKNGIDEYDRTELNIQAQKGIILKKLDSRSITEEEWNRTDNSWREMAALKEECVSRSEAARIGFNTLKVKHDRWVELDRSYKALSNKYGLLEQIQKLLKAEKGKDNSFIDFIAEERLRYIAAKASETLGFMTKYKYALELDTDAGFIIRDNANGGALRMVSSLSGGETFLTSLSLALALSGQIQLKGQSPLEFFFLDEGFGTLDNDLLDTVIDSLERLSRKDRVIGLISHVPELRNRLARRLVIEPPSMQGDGSRVRIEEA